LAKRTAVIDIGSNSVRLVIFEKTSRFAFHLIHEAKSRVRISENAYQNSGHLQEIPLNRAFSALKEFSYIINEYQVRKTLCVATSALRDAPNKKDFIKRVKKELNISIKVIDGQKEAYLGGIAVANLLHLDSALSIDIGGGSTELALYKDKKVTDTYSLDLGTVRLKELYLDAGDIEGAQKHIEQELLKLPQDLNHDHMVGVGGTLRSISKMIMLKEDLAFQKLHGYCFKTFEQENYIDSIIYASKDERLALGVKKDRIDLIQPGLLILKALIKKMQTISITSSGVGVREGLFLSDLLRTQNDTFPVNYNPSVRSLLDRFEQNKSISYLVEQSSKLFTLLADETTLDKKYSEIFLLAIKLSAIGKKVHYYEAPKHAYYILLHGLHYNFSHKDTLLISSLVRYQDKKQINKLHAQKYKDYLPDERTSNTLSFLIRLCLCLFNTFKAQETLSLSLENGTLHIQAQDKYLMTEQLKTLQSNNILTLNIK